MVVSRSIRASDDDRERVVTALREQTAQGRLTLEEFEERVDSAYAARTWGDLHPLTDDLPVEVAFGKADEGDSSRRAPEPDGRVSSSDLAHQLLRLAPALLLLSIAVVVGLGGGLARAVPLLLIAAFLAFGGLGCRPCSPGNRR